MAQPACDASLRISPGKHSRLPPECVAKFAAQKGWLADRKGYALCPEHKPGGAGRPPSDMPPNQKRAAFLAIRDRNIEAAAARMLKPAKPVGDIAKHTAAVRAQTVAMASAPVDAALDLYDRMAVFIAEHQARIWKSRREAANAGGFNIWTFNDAVKRAIARGVMVQEPMRPPASRPFRLRMVDQFDPPAMQPEPMESSMSEEAVVVTVQAEPPRQPTQEDNRRIRDYLDGHFDDRNGRWTDDLSDAKAAERLKLPRAWVSRIREFYGPDTNEAAERVGEQAAALADRAAALEATALELATRAETLGRDVRRFLDGRRP